MKTRTELRRMFDSVYWKTYFRRKKALARVGLKRPHRRRIR